MNTTRHRYSLFRWMPFLVLAAGFVVFDTLAAIFYFDTAGRAEFLVGLVIGAVFGQIVVSAVATTMMPAHFLTRVIAGTVATLLICLALFLHTRQARPPIPFVLSGAAFCQWLIYQIPLWSFRISGWSLHLQSLEGQQDAGQETQFGIRQIFIWTAIVAVFLAITRFIYGMATDLQSPSGADWSVFGILTLSNSVLALPIIWGVFVRRGFLLWMVGAIIWGVLLMPLERLLLSWAIPMLNDDIWIFVAINVGQMLVSLVLLLAIRFTGMRLHPPG